MALGGIPVSGGSAGIPGNGNFELIYPETAGHYYGGPLVSYDGFLHVGVLLNGRINIRKWSGAGTSWSEVYDYASNGNVTGGIKYDGSLFFCNRYKIIQYDGANWTATTTPYSGVDFCEYDGALYLSGDYGRISRKIGAGAWSEILAIETGSPLYGNGGVHYGARFTLHKGSMFSAWRTATPGVKILKFDGSTWSVTKIFSETGYGNVPIYSTGAYMYVGIGTKAYRSADGGTWNEVGVGQFSTINYCFFDWDGVLLALGADLVYASTDGINFTVWRTVSDVDLKFAIRHAGVIYVGGYDRVSLNYTRVYTLTEEGHVPAINGVVGHGTLLHTNLLPSPLLWAPSGFWRPAWTLGGTAGIAGYEAAFVLDDDPQMIYKTAPSDAEMIFTMVLNGSVKPDVYGVAIVGHNLVAANMVTAKFEGGNGNYTDVSEDLVINAAALTPVYKQLSAVASGKDRWRLRIQFSSSTAWQMGVVFLIGAPPLPFARNFNWEGSLAEELGMVETGGDSGVPRSRTSWARYWREFQFENITPAQRDALVVASRNAQVIFSPEGENGCAYLGQIKVRPATDKKGSKFDLVGTFTEVSK